MDFIYRANKLLCLIHSLCAEIDEHERKRANEEIIKSAMSQCTCRIDPDRYCTSRYWFHVNNPKGTKYCMCRVISFTPRKIDTQYEFVKCEHESDFYHVDCCKLQKYVWPKDVVFEHYLTDIGESKIDDKFINVIQPLYEEVRPGFHDNLTKRDVIDTFYLLLLNIVNRTFPGKYDFIKLVMKSTDLLPPLAEIANLKIKMRAFGYKSAIIDKLCEYF